MIGKNYQKFPEAKDMLDKYQAPDLDPAIDGALRAFIEQRKQELPDSDY